MGTRPVSIPHPSGIADRHNRLTAKLRRDLPALAGYALMALALTWPLAGGFSSRLLGIMGIEDLQQTLWLGWWWHTFNGVLVKDLLAGGAGATFEESLRILVWSFFSFPLYVPMGNFFDFFLNAPLQALAGNPLYFNLKGWLLLITNGWGGYLLCLYLTRRRAAAFLGGALIGFNPHTIQQLALGRSENAWILWMPLFVLYLLRTLREERLAPGAAAGLFLALAAITYYFHGMFLLMFLLLALTGVLIRDGARKLARLLPALGLMLVVFWALAFPFGAPYLVRVLQHREIPGVVRPGNPPPTQQGISEDLNQRIREACSLEYPLVGCVRNNIPLVATLLAVIPLLWQKRRPWLWVVTALFFYLLSLGPYLKYHGQVISLAGHFIPLPYLAAYRIIPWFDKLIWPSRSLIMVVIALGVLAAINFSRLLDRSEQPDEDESQATREGDESWAAQGKGKSWATQGKSKTWAAGVGHWTGIIIGMVLVVCFLGEMRIKHQVPIPLTPLLPPAIYTTIIPTAPGRIIELPPNHSDGQNFYLDEDLKMVNYYQTLHHQVVLWGQANGFPFPTGPTPHPVENRIHWRSAPAEAATSNSFLGYLISLGKEKSTYTRTDLDMVRRAGYKYIIIHERFCAHPGSYQPRPQEGAVRYEAMVDELSRSLGPPIYQGTETLWEWTRGIPLEEDPFRDAHLLATRVAAFLIPEKDQNPPDR